MAAKEQPEEGKMEAQAETAKEEKKVEPVVSRPLTPADYEYKSWSGGVPVPDGWERCLGYQDVIRRVKAPLPVEEAAPGPTGEKKVSSCETCKPPMRGGGCCC